MRRSIRVWDNIGKILLNLFTFAIVAVYILPLIFMIVTSLKSTEQAKDRYAPIYPAKLAEYQYEGEMYPIYKIEIDGVEEEWALIDKKNRESTFIDPENPIEPILWEGRWRTLDPVYIPSVTADNFRTIFENLDEKSVFWNTLLVVGITEITVMVASILVAYGFARYPIPGKKWLFFLLLATIILPDKVTLIPTYFMYISVLDWHNTLYPLIVPHLFGNAILIFLLRQNFKSLSTSIEEAAILDGASPLRILWSILLPQAKPTVITAAAFHFFFAWNETKSALLYINTAPELHPISLAMPMLSFDRAVMQAGGLVSMFIPIIVLILSQQYLVRGVAVMEVEK